MKILKYKEYKEVMAKLIEVSEKSTEKILMSNHVTNACIEYSIKEQEHFILLTLGGANQIIGKYCITKGLVNRTQIHPREVFRQAILDNAVSIIIVHNHPSGNTEPSKEDIKVTETIKKAGEIIGIKLLDHVIISPKNNSYSFVENCLF